MQESIMISLLCPKCGKPLTKTRYESKGRWVTSCRIHCDNKSCGIDTGKQCHMSAAYEAYCVMYCNAKSNCEYTNKDCEDNENEKG